jgi:redox-sensitive bicupin YhaK (pirin superfamily)
MKKVQMIRPGSPPHWVGDGFPVRGAFGAIAFTPDVSPFLLLDYAGPAEFSPADEPRGVGRHPHRGFETVTIVYQGEVEHGDSAGNHGTVGAGDVQWMTAASGVLHEEWHGEEFTRRGGTLEMAQLWINLPSHLKMSPPRYQSLASGGFPTVDLGGGTARVIAGDLRDAHGPARTSSPVHVWDVEVAAGGRAELPAPEGFTTLLYIRRGELRIGSEASETAKEGDLVILDRAGQGAVLESTTGGAVLVLSGEPIAEPIESYGPFVMNTREEIAQAIADFQSGRFAAA